MLIILFANGAAAPPPTPPPLLWPSMIARNDKYRVTMVAVRGGCVCARGGAAVPLILFANGRGLRPFDKYRFTMLAVRGGCVCTSRGLRPPNPRAFL